ncbi:MAG: hypothetical protein JWN43_1875 [Gammaproteobacteria bacterium]|nr:hypothetical protein [Gammaproteobacteria bacterium]
MLKVLQNIHPLVLLLIATMLEASGDAVVRMGIYNHAGVLRVALLFSGAALLFGYGSFLHPHHPRRCLHHRRRCYRHVLDAA